MPTYLSLGQSELTPMEAKPDASKVGCLTGAGLAAGWLGGAPHRLLGPVHNCSGDSEMSSTEASKNGTFPVVRCLFGALNPQRPE
jgi:hypothetical protein